jgi:hypothetical protein
MSGGFFVIDRGVWDHPGFASETFTELQAWFWLISSAAWEPCQVRVGRATFDLERGQCAFAMRFLATKWRWSEPRVRRFLKRRASDAQVLVLATREATLITICKYNDYQLMRRADVPENDAGLNQERRKEEEIKTLITKNSSSAETKSRKKPARSMPDIFPASDAMRTYAEKRGNKFEIPPCFAFNKARPGPAQTMFEAFKNHHAAKGSQFADWDAAWRTWVDNQAKWDTERGKPPGLRPAI